MSFYSRAITTTDYGQKLLVIGFARKDKFKKKILIEELYLSIVISKSG